MPYSSKPVPGGVLSLDLDGRAGLLDQPARHPRSRTHAIQAQRPERRPGRVQPQWWPRRPSPWRHGQFLLRAVQKVLLKLLDALPELLATPFERSAAGAPAAPDPPRGKPCGGQIGHPGHERKLYPVEACAEVFEHRPTQCAQCGGALRGDDPQPYRHQVVEIPPITPTVTEHRLHQLPCLACGAPTRAPLPEGVAATGYGPRVVATVAMLSSVLRASQRQTQAALQDLWQVGVGLGTVNALRQEASQAVAEPVAEATAYAPSQAVAHADETGWVQGNADGANPTQRKAWLWVLVTTWVTVFQVKLSRGQVAARELLGTFAGYLVTDRWSGYTWWSLEQR